MLIYLEFRLTAVSFLGDKPFKCPECHLSFRTTGHRQSHLKSHRKAAQADGKAGSVRTVSAAPNKRRLKANKSIKQVKSLHLTKFIYFSLPNTFFCSEFRTETWILELI